MNIFEKTNRYFTFSGSINKNEEFFSSSYITKFNKQKFIPKEATIDTEVGLRKPQIGALYAIQAHWTLSTDDATIVLPTGERVIIVTGCINALRLRVSGTLVNMIHALLRVIRYNYCKQCMRSKDFGSLIIYNYLV